MAEEPRKPGKGVPPKGPPLGSTPVAAVLLRDVKQVLVIVRNEKGEPVFKDKNNPNHPDINLRADKDQAVWRCVETLADGTEEEHLFTIKIRKKAAQPDKAPARPFRAVETGRMATQDLKEHRSNKPVEAPDFKGKAEYKATYKLGSGADWDPHIVIDWP